MRVEIKPAQAQIVYSIREDIIYKVLTEATIQNPDGTIAYNLAQQDMVALRCVMRLGVAVLNPLTKANGVQILVVRMQR